MNTRSRLICMMAAIGAAFSPIAAQANTRAGDSGNVYATNANDADGNAGALLDGEAAGAGLATDFSNFFIALLVGSWFTGVVFIIADDGNNQSPGGN